MLNQVILVGKIVEKKISDKENNIIISVESRRSNDKNVVNLIPISLGEGLEKSIEYLTKDATVGIKASISVTGNEIEIIAEKITFINVKEKNND